MSTRLCSDNTSALLAPSSRKVYHCFTCKKLKLAPVRISAVLRAEHVSPVSGVAQAAASARESAPAPSAAELSLRSLVESYAQEAGMEFLPKARQHEGLQVRLASLVCHTSVLKIVLL